MECIFCDITQKKKPAEIVAEDPDLMVFKDIRPSAPVHLLIVPKKHIGSVKDIGDADKELVGMLVLKAKHVARNQGLEGYKLIFNVGKEGGQLIDHLHLHLLGGWSK